MCRARRSKKLYRRQDGYAKVDDVLHILADESRFRRVGVIDMDLTGPKPHSQTCLICAPLLNHRAPGPTRKTSLISSGQIWEA